MNPNDVDALAFLLEDFDYRIDCDDFLLYELGRLVEEDRASFEDEEFREIIDAGIHEHVDTRLDVRAEIAMRLRRAQPKIAEKTRSTAARILNAVEDTDFPLRDVALILKTYTNYLFKRLENCTDNAASREAEIADALFDALEDRGVVETALHSLGSIQSAVSARVLAHLISEPMLEEDLEMKAYAMVRSAWPLPRHYILYSLKAHNHEDIPFLWFQLLIETKEPDAVERILEEVLAHAEDLNFREDLLALVELLSKSTDPDTQERIMQVLNDPETSNDAVRILEQFLKTSELLQPNSADRTTWERRIRLQSANKDYRAAARLFDSGRTTEAARRLDDLLHREPDYPFAVMLKKLIEERIG